MSLFSSAIAIQSAKRANRLQSISTDEPQTLIAQPTGFDALSGQYIATSADGSEIPYIAGNFRQPTKQISIVKPAIGLLSFGDWN
jgi:ABC-type uncharacterized transport system auxiliary subunit